MLDARFSHLYFCQSLHTLQRGLSAIADLVVISQSSNLSYEYNFAENAVHGYKLCY